MNPNETEGTDISDRENQSETCPTCGMEKKDWGGRTGRGYLQEGETYCCRGCAEGTACTCEEEKAEAMAERGRKSATPAKSSKSKK